MAKVTAKVLGGALKEFEVSSISELREVMGLGNNYSATINGESANEDAYLSDYDFVTLAPAVKGGRS